jgi:transposase
MTRCLPKDTQNNIKNLLESGYSYSQIMERVPGVKKSTISDYKRKWFPEMKSLQSGRHAIVNVTGRNYIRKKLILGVFKTAKDVERYLNDVGIKISYSGCLKLLKSLNFQAEIKKKKPFLNKKHMIQRLNWAKAHQSWTKDDWKRMIFSDETKINVWGSDSCKYFWRRPDDKLQFHHLDHTVKHGGGSLMMWGRIAYDGSGYACQIYDGTMKKEDYIHILETTLKDTMDWHGYDPKTIYFQQDKDPKHTAKATKAWFEDNDFNVDWTYSWPPQSPDLNPIEHVWHHLKLKLSAYPDRAKGVHELWDRVEEQWATFTKEDCQRYIDSMPKRIEAVIKAKGGYTKY